MKSAYLHQIWILVQGIALGSSYYCCDDKFLLKMLTERFFLNPKTNISLSLPDCMVFDKSCFAQNLAVPYSFLLLDYTLNFNP